MKISIAFGGPASGKKRDWDTQVEFLREAEQMGVDIIWSAEAWGWTVLARWPTWLP